MKQETARKTPKWLLPVIIAAAVLVIAGVILAIVLGGGTQQGPSGSVTGPYELYWNIDREANIDPETGLSLRQPDADGKIKIRFAAGGRQVDMYCADKKLVNSIDYMDIMALTFDDNGMIIDAVAADTVATVVAKDHYVRSFDGTTLLINSALTMNGMENTITITEDIGIYNVDPTASEMIGEKYTSLDLMDKLSIYANAEGKVTHIFVTKRAFEYDVYYRFERCFGTDGHTARVPDENGVYTIGFTLRGEKVYLRCKDYALVDAIDMGVYYNKMMGLVFDEEGFIVDNISAAEAIRGKLLYDKYTITAIDGQNISLECRFYEAKDIGLTADIVVDEKCEIYNLCPTSMPDEGAFEGQKIDSLKVGDRIYVWTDVDDNPVMIFVDHRKMDNNKIYQIVSQSYDYEKQETARIPDANGYYVYDMICEGKLLKLRTKSKYLANRIDSEPYGMVGLELKGDVIVNASLCTGVFGNSVYNSWWVGALTGPVCQLVDTGNNELIKNFIINADATICDFSDSYGVTKGQKTKLKVGDRIVALTNEAGEIAYIKILDGYEEGAKLYFNNSRNYDFDKNETGRTPDEDGYYVLDMTCEGKPVQVKTKDKNLVSYIDIDRGLVKALKVSNGIIKGAYPETYAYKFTRIRQTGSTYIKTESDKTVTYAHANVPNWVVDKDTEVYSINRTTVRMGEAVEPQEGDTVRCLIQSEERYAVILITDGKLNSPLYFNTDRQWNSTTKETARTPDKDGYYTYPLAVNGEVKIFKTKDKAIADDMDSYSHAFGLRVKGDIIIKAFSIATKILQDYINTESSLYYFVQSIDGNKVTLINNSTDAFGTENYNKVVELTLAEEYKIYNVCKYAGKLGAETQLQVGDRVCLYANYDGEVTVGFVSEKMTRAAGAYSYCAHCDKEVWWTPLKGDFLTMDMHYYLPQDLSMNRMIRVGWMKSQLEDRPDRQQYEMVLDLNGYTLSSTEMVFEVDGTTLTIMDTAGGGKLIGGATYTERFGGAISVYEGGTLNIYGGTIVGCADETPLKRGGTVYAGGSGGTVNLYGGTITGGNADDGGNLYVGNYSTFNMYGGKLIGGKGSYGGNIYGWGGAKLNLYAGEISGGSAITRGGNIRLFEAENTRPELLIDKDVKILDGVAGQTGGNLSIGGVDAVINGVVSGGKAAEGNNIYADGGCALTINSKQNDASESGENIFISGTAAAPSSLTINNVEVAGGIRVGASTKIVLIGKVNIPMGSKCGLMLSGTGSLVDITELDKASSVVVFAKGVFTTEREDIADFQPVFIPVIEEESVTQQGNALCYNVKVFTVEEQKAEVNAWLADVKAKATFAAGGTVSAKCPVCNQDVTWYPLSGEQSERGFMRPDHFGTTEVHVYLADNVTYTGETDADINYGVGEKTCLYLNGKTFTINNAFKMHGTSNFIGDAEGKIVRPATATGNTKLFWLVSQSVSATFFGGTYENESTADMFLFDFSNKVYNLYGGTFKSVKNFVHAPSNGGSTIMNIDGADISVSGGPAFNLNRPCTVVMNSGTVTYTGETAVEENGGLVQIKHEGVNFTMNGGTISGGKATVWGGNVFLKEHTTLTMNGGQIIGGTAGTRGGNIYANYGATINMTGDAVVAGGTCSKSHNIWLEGATLNMSGNSKIVDVHNEDWGAVNGWYLKAEYPQKVTLADNASIVTTPEQAANGIANLLRIYNSSSVGDILEIAEGWAGEAYLYHNPELGAGSTLNSARIMALGEFSGKLYHCGRQVNYIDGELVLAEQAAAE